MNIIGINAYHGDSAACIVIDGKLIAAVEEERFNRIKHWAGLPIRSISYCLKEAGISISDVDHIAINRDPRANFLQKALFTFSKRPSLRVITDRLKNASKIRNIKELLARELEVKSQKIKAQVHNVEHHTAHLASAYFVSPFDEAAVVSIDGFGDFVGVMWGAARENKIKVKHRTFFPHSLGLFYLAFTQYLGFHKYGDEYKVMGLAAYGEPEYIDFMREIIKIPNKRIKNNTGQLFEFDLNFFIHHAEGVTMTWDNGAPQMGPVYSQKLKDVLGPDRKEFEEINGRHKNIAASLQKRYEEIFFYILNVVYKETKCLNLALAGGCAMNSVANGKIFYNTPFRNVYIQPAAGDAGGAVGAAFYVWNVILEKSTAFVLEKPYLGPEFSNYEIKQILDNYRAKLEKEMCRIENVEDMEKLCQITAKFIADGKVVGWFQGRMEWGPRALGNRSIVCDPTRPDMKDIINLKIKRRESFRPFAPSIQLEATGEYFEIDYPDPFMLKVYKVKPEKRNIIPAVTHVDGTARLQTVRKEDNSLYWQLIEEFRRLKGVPLILNTSFNENEPIVHTPAEAIDCFLRTKMDVLVLGSFYITRTGS